MLLRSALLLLLLALPLGAARAQDAGADRDAYLRGYISAILEQELKLDRASYRMEVRAGVVDIHLASDAEARQAAVIERLRQQIDISALNVTVTDTLQEPPPDAPLGAALTRLLGFTSTRLPFPYGDPFWPLIADPKQPKFYVSGLHYRTPADSFAAASVGYGETFGMYRRLGRNSNDGAQISISGGLFALFNLDAPSHDLINADYTIGFPLSYRKGDTSARLRLYHQSSHLGDEFLLRASPERINLSFESLELLVAQDWGDYRGYLGGEILLRKDPDDLKRRAAHAGIEYRGKNRILDAGQLIAGIDLKSWEENDWYVSKSARFGLEIGDPDPSRRKAALMLEYYQGHAPHGQFYDERISYYGAGIYISF